MLSREKLIADIEFFVNNTGGAIRRDSPLVTRVRGREGETKLPGTVKDYLQYLSEADAAPEVVYVAYRKDQLVLMV